MSWAAKSGSSVFSTIGDGSVWYRFIKEPLSGYPERGNYFSNHENGTKRNRPQWYYFSA